MVVATQLGLPRSPGPRHRRIAPSRLPGIRGYLLRYSQGLLPRLHLENNIRADREPRHCNLPRSVARQFCISWEIPVKKQNLFVIPGREVPLATWRFASAKPQAEIAALIPG